MDSYQRYIEREAAEQFREERREKVARFLPPTDAEVEAANCERAIDEKRNQRNSECQGF